MSNQLEKFNIFLSGCLWNNFYLLSSTHCLVKNMDV